MLLASPPRYQTREGGDSSHPVQHRKHTLCSVLNKKNQAGISEALLFIKASHHREYWGGDTQAATEPSPVQPLGFLTNCSKSVLWVTRRQSPWPAHGILPVVSGHTKVTFQVHMRKASGWTHSMTGFPEPKGVTKEKNPNTTFRSPENGVETPSLPLLGLPPPIRQRAEDRSLQKGRTWIRSSGSVLPCFKVLGSGTRFPGSLVSLNFRLLIFEMGINAT